MHEFTVIIIILLLLIWKLFEVSAGLTFCFGDVHFGYIQATYPQSQMGNYLPDRKESM